jgi:hypothetical protein
MSLPKLINVCEACANIHPYGFFTTACRDRSLAGDHDDEWLLWSSHGQHTMQYSPSCCMKWHSTPCDFDLPTCLLSSCHDEERPGIYIYIIIYICLYVCVYSYIVLHNRKCTHVCKTYACYWHLQFQHGVLVAHWEGEEIAILRGLRPLLLKMG